MHKWEEAPEIARIVLEKEAGFKQIARLANSSSTYAARLVGAGCLGMRTSVSNDIRSKGFVRATEVGIALAEPACMD